MSEPIDQMARRKAKEDRLKAEMKAEAQGEMVSIVVRVPGMTDMAALIDPDEAERLGQMLLTAATKARGGT